MLLNAANVNECHKYVRRRLVPTTLFFPSNFDTVAALFFSSFFFFGGGDGGGTNFGNVSNKYMFDTMSNLRLNCLKIHDLRTMLLASCMLT